MSIEIKIPPVGESITEVQISEWLKSEGDEVKQDEAVAIVDSEKTTFELPAPQAGRLAKILHQAGETVRVGETVAQIETNGAAAKAKTETAETSPAKSPEKTNEEQKTKPEAKPAPQAKEDAPPEGEAKESETAQDTEEKPTEILPPAHAEPKATKPEPVKSEPTQPKVAKPETAKPEAPKLEVDKPKADKPEVAKPVAVKSETTEPAVAKPVTAKPSAGHEGEVVAMSMLRRTVARRLVEAKQTMAMLTTFNEVDMSAVQSLRKEQQEAFEKRHGVKLGLMSFFVKAAIAALKEFPQLNAEIREHDIVYHNYFDIGVAMATERGLVVPVLRNAGRLSFAEVEKNIGDFSQRAKAGGLKPGELEGGTFTITNGGVFGSLLSTPIINPPQTGILGMHTIQERPVALAGQVVIRPMMYLALTYDHRLVDGREAVLFLRRVKELVETPARILLEI